MLASMQFDGLSDALAESRALCTVLVVRLMPPHHNPTTKSSRHHQPSNTKHHSHNRICTKTRRLNP